MAKKVYWKDVRQAVSSSKGRFLSIFSLMAIGALALVGLKVTSPNMERTAQTYIDRYQTMDLAVMADYGLSKEDITELKGIKDAQVEFGYLSDVTIKKTDKAVRLFSESDKISQYQVVSGKLPSQADQIALSSEMSSNYKIGDKISFTQAEGGALKKTEFKITGFVNSSEIWDMSTMGNATVGYGEVTGYGVVSKDAFDSDVYMIARLRYDDLKNLNYYDKVYKEKIAEHQKNLDALLADNGNQRLESLKADNQKEIDKGRAEIAESEKKLTDGAAQIKDAENQTSSGQAKLDSAQREVASNEANLNQSSSQLAQGENELAASQASLAASKSQLDAAKAELDANKAQMDASQEELNTLWANLENSRLQLESKNAELELSKAALDTSKADLDALAAKIMSGDAEYAQLQATLQEKKDALATEEEQDTPSDSTIQNLETQLAQKEFELATLRSEYNTDFNQYNDDFSAYQTNSAAYEAINSQYQEGLATYNTNKAALDAGRAQYEAGLAEYQSGLAAYESGMAQYQAGLARLEASKTQFRDGLAKISSAKSSISSNQADINQALEQLDSSKADYASQKAEAETKITQAKADLDKAQKEIDDLEEPTYTSYNRSSFPGGDGYTTYENSTSSISAVGNIFPVVLYLVAAMVTFTTMTRFVDEERSNAGIFKALGYTNGQIIAKFVIYGFVASMLGTLTGIIAGNLIISPMIGSIITDGMVIGSAKTYFYPSWTLLALILGLISAVLPAYLVARRELIEKPAQLLQAKPPVSGSKIMLERLPFIWKRLSFTHKVTARNIFRYKQRMLMTIFGVAGSAALLFAGLGIQSSISGVADSQFGDILKYDMIVAENSKATEEEKEELTDLLASKQVASSLPVSYLNLTEDIPKVSQEQTISLIVSDSSDLSDFIQLRQRTSKEALNLTDSGAIITEKLAKLYKVKAGDSIKLTINDKKVTVKVDGIAEMYAGHFVYMTSAYFEKVTSDKYESNAYLVGMKDKSTKKIQALAADFMSLKAVAAVVQNTSLVKLIRTVANSLQSIMIILIVLSVMLGIVILYNLTNINVAERIRELSTIKVLGFHNKEVTLYIYRETIALSLIGMIVGLLGGYGLHQLLLHMIGSDNIMFNPSVEAYVYITPILAITGILTVLGFFVNHRLRHVDMLEALKSVE